MYPQWGKIPLAGEWRRGSSEFHYENRNPYTNELIIRMSLANKMDINQAFIVADRVQKEWNRTSPERKRDVLLAAIRLFEERKDELVNLLIEESGSTRQKANLEVDMAVRYIHEASTFPLMMKKEQLASIIPNKKNYITRSAVGVVSVITPWNFPFNLAIRSVAPALAAGNAVILKPDNQTAITGGSFISKVFEDAGAPKGLISVIVADLAEIGDLLVEHSIPQVISFTGSSKAGKHIASVAGRLLKKATLELGGNNAMVVLEDADLNQAVAAAIIGKFLHQGQICMSINRIIVDKKVVREFVEKFTASVRKLKVGDPKDNETNIGPMINEHQVKKVKHLINKSIDEGAAVIVEGSVEGNTMSPWVLTNVTNQMSIAKEEIFGPVAIILEANGEDDAMHLVNDTPYGLVGAVFTKDIERGMAFAENIQCGMFHINDMTINSEPFVPFGGEKDSGLGRHGGTWSIDEFTSVKWVSIQKEDRKYLFP
ncbi:aldehyde dehydrogenase family protein [Neobacillus niacini]|uniref:aldehyde dehydrogenase family protein n=1 Tax=Neobacillus niacini TaxID=86668 RepID=UPI00288BA995|nr:aldehyde dehydrogenase family protein [Neobacillus niacini]